MASNFVSQLVKQLSSNEDYEEFLSSCSEEQLSPFRNALVEHTKSYVQFTEAKKQKVQDGFIGKVSAAFADDAEMVRVLTRIIKGDFDHSKVLALGVQIALPMDEEESPQEEEESPESSREESSS